MIDPTHSIYDAAVTYVAAGLSVIPIAGNGKKGPAYGLLPIIGVNDEGRPRHSWKPFQSRLPTEDELRNWFTSWGGVPGIAVVCGHVSGDLEAIDIDSAEYAEPWLAEVQSRAPGLQEKLILVRTPRPGLHVYYRCAALESNQKLAQIALPTAEGCPPDIKTIIETRGQGGYAMIPPTPGYCHPTGREYQYVTSKTLADVQTISAEERAILIQAAKSFDSPPVRPPVMAPRLRPSRLPSDLRRPGDDFDHRVSWQELLEGHGWRFSHQAFDGIDHWTRPGKSEGTSATVNYEGIDLLHVFTSNAPPLEAETSYTKFAFYAHMEHDGDFTKAAAALRAAGFGQPTLPAGRRPCPRNQRHDRNRRRGSMRPRRRG
jgi:hypothetical protein